jgi:predicted transcriptional regulator
MPSHDGRGVGLSVVSDLVERMKRLADAREATGMAHIAKVLREAVAALSARRSAQPASRHERSREADAPNKRHRDDVAKAFPRDDVFKPRGPQRKRIMERNTF